MKFFEDIKVRDSFETGRDTITRESIIEFAKKYDPQPMHLSDEGASQTVFKELVASGWQTFTHTMKLVVDAKPLEGTPLVGMRISEMAMLKPLLPGETIYAQGEVVSKKDSSNPNKPLGYVDVKIVTYVNDGEKLAYQTCTLAVPKKS